MTKCNWSDWTIGWLLCRFICDNRSEYCLIRSPSLSLVQVSFMQITNALNWNCVCLLREMERIHFLLIWFALNSNMQCNVKTGECSQNYNVYSERWTRRLRKLLTLHTEVLLCFLLNTAWIFGGQHLIARYPISVVTPITSAIILPSKSLLQIPPTFTVSST